MSITNRLSEFLGIAEDDVRRIIEKAPRNYKMYQIPKKSGGTRTLFHPSKETKAVQYAIMETLLCHLPVHAAAMAYRPGVSSPTKVNALIHAKYPYSLHIDFKDFFPSIHPQDLFQAIENHYGKGKLSLESMQLLLKSLFVSIHGNPCLAIGAPSSPMISNAVMYQIDQRLNAEASRIESEAAYTRYADDICFSCSKKGGCNEFAQRLEDVLSTINSPRLKINPIKTRFTSRKGRRIITGLFLLPDGKISIGRQKKRYIRSLIHNVDTGKTSDPKELVRIKGYLAYVADVEPDYYGAMVVKFGSPVFIKIYAARV